MHLLRVENEENAVVCVKIIIDLHRSFRHVLEDQVQPFLDIVQEIYQNMEQTVKDAFDSPTTPAGPVTPGPHPLLAPSPRPMSPAADTPETPSKVLPKGLFSFKVLTECPIIVVLLFQSHRRYAGENIMKFVPLIFQTLKLEARPQQEASAQARARGEVFVGVSPEIRNRTVYNDFLVAQVKTMSFLAYILRSYNQVLRPYQNQIPEFVLRLLRECPPESSATRKELLVATRHILSTDFRQSFVSKIDLLLNEKVLIGTGVTSHDTLRPLAYSMLADLVHHIRSDLTPQQLLRTVCIYSRNLHDATLAPSIQTMCGKLLLNLIDCIIKIPSKEEGRALLMRILDAFASKFAALNIQFKSCLRHYKKKKRVDTTTETDMDTTATTTTNELEDFDFDKKRSIHTATFIPDSSHDGIKDGRFLFRNLALGLKPLFIGLRHCNSQPPAGFETTPQTYGQFARGFSQDDVETFLRLFREGLVCFEYYNVDNYNSDCSPPNYGRSSSDAEANDSSIGSNELSLKLGTQASAEKEILDMFSIVFTLIDPAVFQEIFASQIGFFFERMLVNPMLIHIAQYFLVTEVSSQGFAGILFRFLIDRIERLGDDDMHYSAVMLHLFRLAFMAVNLFPDANESILQPYLANLVMSCFKLSAKAKEPANYFLLLRALFKSIGGGRFELLYKEVSPLLQILLENLNSLLTLAHKPEMRNLFVELCLAVPVRLSTLLPYLPYLMRPLVIALQADQELVSQGLRTMELCNDNLNPEFLDHIMAPVMKELMDALWSHLKPLPYNQTHSHAAMRILGKLGGRNRRMLKSPPKLEYNARIESGVSVEVTFDPNTTPYTLPLDKSMQVAARTLERSDVSPFYKKYAYDFLKTNLILMLELDEGTEDLPKALYQRVKEQLLDGSDDDEADNASSGGGDENKEEQSSEKVTGTGAQTGEGESTVVGNALSENGIKPKRLSGNGYTKYLSKRLAQEEALRTIFVSIMKASTIPTLAEEAWDFFQNVCRHFTLLHIGEAMDAHEGGKKPLSDMMEERLAVQNLNTTILVDAVVEVISSEDARLRKRAEQILQLCFDTAVTVLGGKEYVSRLPIFRVFASQFCSCCYKQEWYKKRGGCLGISIMSAQLDMGIKWMREHELDFIRSLLFVLKDASPEMANINTAEATQTLSHVLKVCNRPDEEESQEAQQKFHHLISLLLSELSNSNSAVRETIQSSFQLLADLTGNEVTELLAPVRERLVAPIFAKPLRALPFAMQIGHIDAITYCLTLRPPFLEFNEELIRLLHEALALADAEDQALVSRSSQYKNATSLMNLRIVCIKLLSAAMACSDFSSQRQTHTRARIIQVFFKSLYSKSPEVVEAAHRGLKQVLAQQHKLPKELLQQGLRPILTTLSNHKTLSVPGLEGLARLLELLTNYFKVEIGKKLLDHLKQWADPKVLQEAAGKSLNENHEVKIIVAILNIFHLLPAAAHIFLNDLVTVVIDMEKDIRRTVSSPFRPNLIKYLNRYPTETVAYFYERLNSPQHSRLFVDLLGTENATPLRDEVAKSPQELVNKTFNISDNATMHYQGVLIVRQMIKYEPDWLANQKEVLTCLLTLWRSSARFEDMKKEDQQGIQATRESFYLAQIFIAYLRSSQDDIEVVFDLVALFAHETVMDLSFLRAFFLEDVAMKFTPTRKRKMMDKFLQLFSDSSYSNALKMMALRHVINPALLVAFNTQKGGYTDIFDNKMMEQLDFKLWGQLTKESLDDNRYAKDSLRIELLQLTAMIVQYAPQLLADLRKEVIKFGWNYLRLEDATSKQSAYVLIARFIAAYETPSKIAIQIYQALLRAHLSEARNLVKQGLDILAPVLPKRVPLHNGERVPTWVRLTRKVVVEDTHSISQMVNVYQLLVRQPDLFYDYREHFLPQIVNTLPKLGLFQNATPEHKLLTVELSELILKWERKRLESQPKEEENINGSGGDSLSPKRKAGTSESDASRKKLRSEGGTPATPAATTATATTPGPTTTATPSASTPGPATPSSSPAIGNKDVPSVAASNDKDKEFAPNLALRENLIGYLVRLACTIYNPQDMIQRRLVQRVLELMKEFLTEDMWSDVHVKFSHLERTLTVKDMSEILIPSVCSALEVLNIDIAHKPNEWFIVNMNQLYRLLETSIKSDHVRIQNVLHPVLVRIFQAIHGTTPTEGAEQDQQHPDVVLFISHVNTTITDGIGSMSNNGIYAVLKLLQAASSSRSEHLDQFIPGIIKLLQKLTKEHMMPPSHAGSSVGQDSSGNLLILVLMLLKKRISHLGDQRRWFLTYSIQLIEKSSDINLLRTMLEMLSEWTLDRTETFPTIKEKAGMLVKMMTVEHRNDQSLTEEYLNLVLKIYSNPTFARSELTVRLENAFLLGTRNDNPQIRTQFMRVFDRSIARTLYARLSYIIGVQNWEFLAQSFWLHQALDLLLGVVKANPSVSLPHALKIKSIKIVGGNSHQQQQDSGMDVDVPEPVQELVSKHQAFLKELQGYDVNNAVSAVRQLQYLDDELTRDIWIDLFPMCWTSLGGTERHDMTKLLINLLTKDYHSKQAERRPNVIQALLAGIARTPSTMKFPPHLIKFLGKTHDAWHTAMEILQQPGVIGRVSEASKDDQNNRERTLDALAELYSDLNEEDMFDGLWRRRSTYSETNVAVSCEQSGMWMQAQNMYENAQIKARSGVLPFTESEYMLWEDHWIACTQKLQQWDILTDLAKHDGNINLLLECSWRLSDWTAERELLEQSLQQVSDTPTPRHKVFEAFLSLIKSQTNEDRLSEFTRICEEGVQLSLRKWHALPPIVAQSHIPLLQSFQQFLELQEASQIFNSLMTTTAQNLDQRSQDLRSLLGTWRERLPNMWDDINVWSDLVAWRQHIFSAINRTYLPLIPLLQPQSAPPNTSTGNSFAYRGYHETAWIINRFAHVARKHQLYDVCINYLTKIYTLPNIEIQEAFLKLREQAKCYYQNPNELTAGLDVINNTNLMYFTHQQKAEFFTLKGMFLARLNHFNEANEAFVNAVQIDLSLPRAWAEWGRYNDRRFKENPKDLSWANNAVSCYLQAAGIYKNAKARKYLLRVLWLLSLDDQNGTISMAFDGYKGEWPVWYWITFIPQLLTALQHRETRHARAILIRIAKQYPQALHFQLRTAKEELIKRTPSTQSMDSMPSSMPSSSESLSINTHTGPMNKVKEEPMTPSATVADAKAMAALKAAADNASSSSTTTTSTNNNEGGESTSTTAAVPVQQTQGDQNSQVPSNTNGENTPMDEDKQVKESGEKKTDTAATVKQEDTGGDTTASNANNKTGDSNNKADGGQSVPQSQEAGGSSSVNNKNQTAASAAAAAAVAAATTASNDTNKAQQPATVNGARPNNPGQPGIPNPNMMAGLASGTHPLDEIMAMLKTGYPLLALSMETMVDQIQLKFKPLADEDMYRLVVALYNEGAQQLLTRLTNPGDTLQLTQSTVNNIVRFADSLYPGHMKTAFYNDFAKVKLNLEEYVAKLRLWRDKFEAMLDARPRKQKLEALSCYLAEFHHARFDDVEIPGQYLLLKDNANDFLRIDRFMPEVEFIRWVGTCSRRLTIRGHDGSLHPFLIQNPAPRHLRREERLMQLFRLLNGVLERRKESRMRNLSFHLPVIVPLAPNVRIVQDDPSNCTLHDIYEDYCDDVNMHKDDPLAYYADKLKNSISSSNNPNTTGVGNNKDVMAQKAELLNLRMEINDEISNNMVPSNILSKYMLRTMGSYTDYYMLRKQFTAQYATATFMTYIFSVGQRTPNRIAISRSTGDVWMTEFVPSFNQTNATFGNGEPVPFRFTPNIQEFITPVGIEGPFTSCLVATARCLTEPELELDQYLGPFVRDELMTWHTANNRNITDAQFKERVTSNVMQIVAKAQFLSCKADREKTINANKPTNQNVIDLISQASNPQKMAQVDCTWMPWL
ncbi:hypothetical protein BDC45DRAFT_550494 [Circinella umbellata]|nr:hypothetical protein BDC45DRAFT_550494 [Circinella umbellata]